MSEEIKRVKRELMYEGTILKIYKDHMQFENGNTAEWDFIHHDGAAAVVPIMEDGRILMVTELEEETGYRSENLEWILTLRTTVAFCDERIEVYVAKDLIPSRQNLDEDEYVDVKAYTLEELKEKIFDGTIQDSKTVAALLAYESKYLRKK